MFLILSVTKINILRACYEGFRELCYIIKKTSGDLIGFFSEILHTHLVKLN